MAETEKKPLTKVQVAAMVKREVPVLKDGKPTGNTKQVAIKADEILDFAEYDDHVVVVTRDGLKVSAAK